MPALNFGSKEPKGPHRVTFSKVLVGLSLASILAVVGSTLASNISLNSGNSVEFGQGVVQTTACDESIFVAPRSVFRSSSFYLSDIQVSGINSSDGHCKNKDFKIQIFDASTGTPLELSTGIDKIIVVDDGDNFIIGDFAGITISQPQGDNSTFTLHFDAEASPAYSGQVNRISIETSDHVGAIPCPSVALNGWTKIYQTTSPRRVSGEIQYTAGFGLGQSDAAAVFDGTSPTIHHIRDRMQMTVGGVCYFADVTYDAWGGVTADDLKVPDQVHEFSIQRDVSNLTVTSNYPNVVNGTGLDGRLEIWPWDYDGQSNLVGLTPTGDSSAYDYDDRPGSALSPGWYFGSFQVHNITNLQTVLAWNEHSDLQPSWRPNVGFGNSTASNSKDWTADTSLFDQGSNWKLQIFVD